METFLAMMPQLIPVSKSFEALVAGVRKTAFVQACMVLKTPSAFECFPTVITDVGLSIYLA